MRTLIYCIFLLTTFGCVDTTQKDKSSAIKIELIPESNKNLSLNTEKRSESTTSAPKPSNCSASDLLKLKNKGLQVNFFKQLDSLRKYQYENIVQDIYNSVDITPTLLRKFLNDVNIDSLQETGIYECYYFFNIAPPQFIDSKKCKDKIIIQYSSTDCGFKMMIDNVYLVKENEDETPYCIGGAQVVYDFKIVGGKIVAFRRYEIG